MERLPTVVVPGVAEELCGGKAKHLGGGLVAVGGCGSAVLAAAFPNVGIGLLGVSFGLWAGKRFPGSELGPYIVAQVIGAILGAGILYVIASGKEGFSLAGGFASNGYGVHSPGGYTLFSGLVAELMLTFMFLMVILGATDSRAPKGFAPIAIGLALTLIHLISIPVTKTSVNPARSTGPALFVGAGL